MLQMFELCFAQMVFVRGQLRSDRTAAFTRKHKDEGFIKEKEQKQISDAEQRTLNAEYDFRHHESMLVREL